MALNRTKKHIVQNKLLKNTNPNNSQNHGPKQEREKYHLLKKKL